MPPPAVERPSTALSVAVASFGVMAVAQGLVPFFEDRVVLTTIVVVGFFVTTSAAAAEVWEPGRVALAAGAVVAATAALEWVGSNTGWPFGEYRYADALQPQVGGVPVVVPLAWFAMVVPAREVAARLARPGWRRVALAAVAMTAWDVMLDPQMVDEGYWVWAGDGFWRDVPLSNYGGWLVSSAAVVVALDRLLPAPGRSRSLLGLYTWWAVMETVAFLAFFGDPLVGVVGGLAMLPLAALAWRAERRAGAGERAPARG